MEIQELIDGILDEAYKVAETFEKFEELCWESFEEAWDNELVPVALTPAKNMMDTAIESQRRHFDKQTIFSANEAQQELKQAA